MPAAFWHSRYKQQAVWTDSIRRMFRSLYFQSSSQKILDVGSGTGVISYDFSQHHPDACVYGLDIRQDMAFFASQNSPATGYTCGDALALPFEENTFDITFCHYFLLWLQSPLAGLEEMQRVTKPGGIVAALAEPDYGGRIDYPDELANLGMLQAEALHTLGANPYLGRQLKSLLKQAGFEEVQCGLLGGEWSTPPQEGFIQQEWEIMKQDLKGWFSTDELTRLQQADLHAWQAGVRILYVPTFYGWGKIPG